MGDGEASSTTTHDWVVGCSIKVLTTHSKEVRASVYEGGCLAVLVRVWQLWLCGLCTVVQSTVQC